MAPTVHAARLAHRVGHRGAYLLFLFILDLAFGYSLISEPVDQFRQFDTFLPESVWAGLWLAVGLTCGISAFLTRDRIAFAAGAGIKVAWAGVSAEAWLLHHLYRGWVSVIVWVTFATTTLIIASWPEPEPRGRGHPPAT